MSVRILIGDMAERLRDLPDNSVDSCVTDPPYHLTSVVKRFAKTGGADRKLPKKHHQYHRLSKGFMGQTWDGGDVAFRPETWAEVLRVLKPGGHLLAFSGTRTVHRMVCAIEDAGFEIRDSIAWLYGSGFPKSHDVAKQIDKAAGAEREVVGTRTLKGNAAVSCKEKGGTYVAGANFPGVKDIAITAPATDAAREWQGWGTALKPAMEMVCVARKPISEKNVAANVLRWGTGALNIDGCRIAVSDADARDVGRSINRNVRASEDWGMNRHEGERVESVVKAEGRWPANIVHDGSDEVVAGFPETPGALAAVGPQYGAKESVNAYGDWGPRQKMEPRGDTGSAARFFYCAKAATEERGEGNNHPTVKPVELMRWLCRLVTPKGGLVLDPFTGSGSTALACEAEQFSFVGCELSPEYAAIAERRIRDAAGLFADISVEHCPARQGAAA